MIRWLIFFILLSLHQKDVFGCKSKCPSTGLYCPTGKRFSISKFERYEQCIVEEDRNEIINNCWSNQRRKARNCMDDNPGEWKGINGCSAEVLAPAMNKFFLTACNIHDLCYRAKGMPKSYCDSVFYSNLKDSCDREAWWSYPACRASAKTAYGAVKYADKADEAYKNGQANGCWRAGETRTKSYSNLDNLELVESYSQFQKDCWALLGKSTESLWNSIHMLIKNCKHKKNKKISIQCWKNIKNNIKVELQKKKSSLIDCVNIQTNTSKEDFMIIEQNDLWQEAENNETVLISLVQESMIGIENIWKKSQDYWNKCWKKLMKLVKRKEIKKAAKMIDSCWRMKIDDETKENLDLQ